MKGSLKYKTQNLFTCSTLLYFFLQPLKKEIDSEGNDASQPTRQLVGDQLEGMRSIATRRVTTQHAPLFLSNFRSLAMVLDGHR